MNTIYLHLPRVHTHRVLDTAPVPWRRRTARAAVALLTLVVVVPLLWLLGGLVALALLGGAAAMLVAGVVHAGRLDRAERRSADASRPFDTAP